MVSRSTWSSPDIVPQCPQDWAPSCVLSPLSIPKWGRDLSLSPQLKRILCRPRDKDTSVSPRRSAPLYGRPSARRGGDSSEGQGVPPAVPAPAQLRSSPLRPAQAGTAAAASSFYTGAKFRLRPSCRLAPAPSGTRFLRSSQLACGSPRPRYKVGRAARRAAPSCCPARPHHGAERHHPALLRHLRQSLPRENAPRSESRSPSRRRGSAHGWAAVPRPRCSLTPAPASLPPAGTANLLPFLSTPEVEV